MGGQQFCAMLQSLQAAAPAFTASELPTLHAFSALAAEFLQAGESEAPGVCSRAVSICLGGFSATNPTSKSNSLYERNVHGTCSRQREDAGRVARMWPGLRKILQTGSSKLSDKVPVVLQRLWQMVMRARRPQRSPCTRPRIPPKPMPGLGPAAR